MTVCVAVGMSVGVWVAFGDDKGAGVELGRTGFAGGGVAVGIGEGIRVGLGVGTWTVTVAWAVFPARSQAWNSTVWLPSVLIVTVEPSCQVPPSTLY
jgi:hypothetical protein